MAEISADNEFATFINLFPTKPRDQQKLVDLIVKAHEELIRHRPGYISGNVHRSVDGYQVVDYTQWRRREDFEAMVRDPASAPHFMPIGELTQGRQGAYDVVYTHVTQQAEGVRQSGTESTAMSTAKSRTKSATKSVTERGNGDE